MASDQIVELMELISEDPEWHSEFYSAVANSDLIMPMLLLPGHEKPSPMAVVEGDVQNPVFDTVITDAPRGRNFRGQYFNPPPRPQVNRCFYCLVYSSWEIYEGVKQILYDKYQSLGKVIEPVTQNGRQFANQCCKKKQSIVINEFTACSSSYRLSFRQLEIIRGTRLIDKPKIAPEVALAEALTKQNLEMAAQIENQKKEIETLKENNEKQERGIRQLQTHLSDSLKENGELKARLNDSERLVGELESSLSSLEATCGSSFPVSVGEAVENAGRRYASRLIIHPGVKDIAEAWQYQKKPVCVAHAVKMLDAVARTLYRMKFESPEGCIDPLEFQRLTGYELGMTEGKMTKHNPALDALRYCKYEDQTVPIHTHLKKRIAHNLQMRIYIGFIEEKRKIFIGHVGEHLATSETPVRRAY